MTDLSRPMIWYLNLKMYYSYFADCFWCTLRPRHTSPTGTIWALALPLWRSTERRLSVDLVWLLIKSTTSSTACWPSVNCTPSSWESTLLTLRYTGGLQTTLLLLIESNSSSCCSQNGVLMLVCSSCPTVCWWCSPCSSPMTSPRRCIWPSTSSSQECLWLCLTNIVNFSVKRHERGFVDMFNNMSIKTNLEPPYPACLRANLFHIMGSLAYHINSNRLNIKYFKPFDQIKAGLWNKSRLIWRPLF